MEQRHKPTVKRGHKPYVYHIESKSRPGRYYVTDAYRMTCTCEAGRARRRCWHVALAISYDGWRKHEQARRDAANWSSAPATAASWGSAPAPRTEGGMQALAEAFA